MQTTNAKALPSRDSGSQAAVSELPIVQQNEQLFIDARLLHQKVESNRQFADWIKKRIEDYGFEKEKDYFTNLGNRSDGLPGKPRTEYLLTLDTAKELAMVERNEAGRRIRKYFIAKEKELRQLKAKSSAQLPESLSLQAFWQVLAAAYTAKTLLPGRGFKIDVGQNYLYIRLPETYALFAQSNINNGVEQYPSRQWLAEQLEHEPGHQYLKARNVLGGRSMWAHRFTYSAICAKYGILLSASPVQQSLLFAPSRTAAVVAAAPVDMALMDLVLEVSNKKLRKQMFRYLSEKGGWI